ncbi:MAG: 1-acyl-sn-glycerol-3-phosphate acyltransferase [Bacteroidales bacterium]|nr:1-acyl-sn-glycerol-3-phosphate acyltransferase [Bacteroidales bacterium]
MPKNLVSPRLGKPLFLYRLLFRSLRFYYHLYYKRVTIIGQDKLPENVPLIITPNHQNALMDALAVLFAIDRPVFFLARADIFKKSFVARLLYFLRILPVYRLRDGTNSLEKNKAVFAETARLLQKGWVLTIMPEGVHSKGKTLQPLKKGASRIAFQTAEADGFKSPVFLVPFGIDYEHPDKAGTQLLINIGTPLPVAPHYVTYQHEPQKAFVELRDELTLALKSQIVHLDTLELEDCHRLLCSLSAVNALKSPDKNRVDQFRKAQKIAEYLNGLSQKQGQKWEWLQTTCKNYLISLKEHKLNELSAKNPLDSWLTLVVQSLFWLAFLPLQVYGVLCNYLPYKLPSLLIKRIKDKQFVSSLNFGLSFFLFLIWYALLFVAMLVFFDNWVLSIFALVSFPYAGLLAFYQFKFSRRLRNSWRWKIRSKNKPKLIQELLHQRQSLINQLKLWGV